MTELPAWSRILLWMVGLAVVVGGFAWLREEKQRSQDLQEPTAAISNERIAIQRTTDPDAASVDQEPRSTTLADLRHFERPQSLDSHPDQVKRLQGLEGQIWRIRAKVVEVTVHEDGDYYLVLEQNGERFVGEVPDPKLCEASPFKDQIATVRRLLERDATPTAQPTPINRVADIEGVGFFGKKGKTDNGARLLPVTAIKWIG
jgi:hypothetical protein